MPDPLLDILDRVQGSSAGGDDDPLLSMLDAVQGEQKPDTRSTFSRAYDAVFTPPEAVTRTASRVADAIDSPSLERSPWRARLEGFAAGATEGLASLLTPGDIALTALGLRPVASAARNVRGGAQLLNTVQQGANVASVLRGGERLADAESLSEAAAGVGQAALGAAGAMAGRRPSSPSKAPGILALPPGARFTAASDGRVAEVGTDIPMAQAPDGSFVRGVPAEYARHEIVGLLREGRTPIITEPPAGSVPEPIRVSPSGGRSVPAVIASYDERGGPVYSSDPNATPARREVRGLLPPGPRFVAGRSGVAEAGEVDALLSLLDEVQSRPPSESGARSVRPAVLDREVDPTVPAREGVRVRQYASDPDAVDAPFVDADDRRMLETMREDLATFAPERGRLIDDPHDPGFSRYSPGTAGSAVADDIRIISEQNVSNRAVLAAVDDLLAGKPPTNRLHTAALDAARGYRERRPGYRGPAVPMARAAVEAPAGGGGEPVPDEDFAAFSRMFDEVEPSAGREPGEEGFITSQLAAHLGGGAAGAAYGAGSGEDTEDRIKRGLLFGLAGAVAPALLRSRTPGIISRQPSRPSPGVISGQTARPGPGMVTGTARSGAPIAEPTKGFEPFLAKFTNPLVRNGVASLIAEHGGYAAQRRGVIDSETVGRFADEVRVNASQALPKGSTLNAEAVTAYARALRSTQEKVNELAARVQSGRATDADLVALQAARAEADVIGKSLVGARAEAGRALAAFNFYRGILDTGDVTIIRDALKAPGLREEAERLARGLAEQGDDPIARFRWLQQQKPATLMDKVRSYYYANILSGIKTHERNLIGNLANVVTNLATHPVAAGLDAVASATRGTPRTVRLDELPSQVFGAIAGLDRGLRDFAFTMRHGMSPGALTRGVEAGERGKLDVPRVEFAGGAANPFNLPGRLLNATDALFRSIARNMELYGLAHAQARSEGLSGQRFTDRVAALRSGQTDEGAALAQQAETFATRSVFQEQPGAFASYLQQGVQRFPALSFIVPFVRTPANIMRQGFEFSPVGAAMAPAREGGRTGRQAQARVALGTGAAAALAYLAATGRLSGDGPRDASQRAALMESGWRPNSVRIGDQWVSYSLFQPVSVQAAIIANVYEGWREQGAQADPSTLDAIGQTVFRSLNSFLSQSFLSGLSDFLEAVSDPERSFGRVAGRTASGFIPLTGAVRSAQQAADPVVRQPKGVAETVKAGVPGLSTSVEPRIDRFGEVVRREGGPVRRAADPLNLSSVRQDPIALELARLGIDLSLPSDRLALPGGQALTRGQETDVKQRRGQAVRQALERLMADPRYARLNDAGRQNAIDRLVSRVRGRTSVRLRGEVARGSS